jgi:hypothetical protein
MNVPLDRLYNFLQGICNLDVLIYRFVPHGSRKTEDCKPLDDYYKDQNPEILKKITMICHDQEPLNHKDYVNKVDPNWEIAQTPWPVLNINTPDFQNSYHDFVLLLHSEQHSQDVKWFEQHGSVAVYWWSHAVIALDWFRYAKVDPLLTESKTIQKDFLIYNRAWSGSREYRLKFVELVLDHNLQDHCQLTFNPIDNGTSWTQHKFANQAMAPTRTDLDQHFPLSTVDATASADYVSVDYSQTGIEVVLETIFDDIKWHLTEKALRPIACGQPFILVSTPGILQYLKSYGFQTFGDYIDESYDSIQDPVARLQAVAKLMQSLASLSPEEKQQLYANLAAICRHNKQRFFSEEFAHQVVDELRTNFNRGASFIQQADSHKYHERDFKRLAKFKELRQHFFRDNTVPS